MINGQMHDSTYDVILLVLSEEEIVDIKKMDKHCVKYCVYPEKIYPAGSLMPDSIRECVDYRCKGMGTIYTGTQMRATKQEDK